MVRFLQQNDEEIDKNSKRLTNVTSLGNCQPENPKNAAKYKMKHTKLFFWVSNSRQENRAAETQIQN